MKVLFFCAISVDWDNPVNPPSKFQRWSEFHKIDFFQFRKTITEVAVASWKATGADVYINKSNWWNNEIGQSFHDLLNLTDEQLHLISQYDYVIPIDDDDIFAPHFIDSISMRDGSNVIVWDCLMFEIFNGSLRPFISSVVYKQPVPYFHNEIGHWREQIIHPTMRRNEIHWEIASATYGLKTKWLLADPARNVCFFSHWKATSCFGDPSTGYFPYIDTINDCLGCKIMHGANVSTLNFESPLKPIYDLESQWRPHWPKTFYGYYNTIQNKINESLA